VVGMDYSSLQLNHPLAPSLSRRGIMLATPHKLTVISRY
jgi:hypothetical protein